MEGVLIADRPTPHVPAARRGSTTRWVEATRTLVVQGDVDHRTIDELRSALDDLARRSGPATVDLRGTSFFPTAAITVLAEASRRHDDGFEVLVAEGSPTATALRVLGVAHRVVPPTAGTDG